LDRFNRHRKAAGREAKLCYMGHATMENRHGLAGAGMVTLATGTAERRLQRRCSRPKSRSSADALRYKAYDTADHVSYAKKGPPWM